MDITVREATEEDYESIKRIYLQGINTKRATFQREPYSYEDWNKGHLKECRFVAVDQANKVLGWISLAPYSSRCVYKGVAEVSIYIAEEARNQQVGSLLMDILIRESEKIGIWTLQSGIIQINEASIALHKKFGFRMVGYRERIAKDMDGNWQNTVLMERRSPIVGFD